jgi:hypothetical protein
MRIFINAGETSGLQQTSWFRNCNFLFSFLNLNALRIKVTHAPTNKIYVKIKIVNCMIALLFASNIDYIYEPKEYNQPVVYLAFLISSLSA